MAKRKTTRKGIPSMAGYEGLCSRFTDLVGMKSTLPSAAWEMHVVDRTLTILKFEKPELLEEIKSAVKECYETNGKRFPPDTNAEGSSTIRCPACGKTR